MALETKLIQKLSQSLLMTPQLQQAIKLLQLGRLEYLEAIEKELLENPVLEEIREGVDEHSVIHEPQVLPGELGTLESTDFTPLSEAAVNAKDAEHQAAESPNGEAHADWEGYLDSFTDANGTSAPKGSGEWDERSSVESTLTRAETLGDHILAQISLSELQGEDITIAEYVIGSLNREGYLCCSQQEICEACGCALSDVERVVSVIQYLDPPGIAAKDLQECLLIQLDVKGLSDSLESRIIQNHLDKLEKMKYEQIAKEEGVAVERVHQAIHLIRTLEPRPGHNFGEDDTRYVVPDIYVYKVGTEYVISLNEEGLPRLRISPYYIDMLNKDGDASEGVSKGYLKEHFKAASWLIKSIQQRQQTIFKVTESIVKFQRDFLDKGIQHLRPMVLKDVAEDIGMHESTVSRVTSNKYVHTPQGVFELKFFFTTALKTASGVDISSSSIKEQIKALIAAESPDNPVSDQQIVNTLKSNGIEIARRTVAKYRENLGILSSSATGISSVL